MGTQQLLFILLSLLAFVLLGFAFSRSLKKYDAKKAAQKKKKGRYRYMPESKRPGR